MKKQILADVETKRFLMKAFGCSAMAVWRALNFERHTEQARRIRFLALQRGGRLTEGHAADCDTEHDTANGTMTLRFGSRVKIVYDRRIDEATLWVDGARHGEVRRNPGIPGFVRLQSEAEQLAKSL